MKNNRDAARKRSTSNDPSGRTNFIKLIDARLQAVSSRNMYSLHGIRRVDRAAVGAGVPLVDRACRTGHRDHRNARRTRPSCSAVPWHRTTVRRPLVLSEIQRVCQRLLSRTASMYSSVTRTDKFAFWKQTLL